jgi:4-hydroxybenzoate polyprenyltransferase
LYFLLNSNIFISLAAVLLTIETQVQLGMKPQFHPYLFIIFFATLFEYNFHRMVTVFTCPDALNDKKHKWLKQNLNQFYILMAISAMGFMVALLFAKKQVLIALAPIAVITLFYSLPVFRNKKRIFRLREIPLLKIFLIAFVWSVSTIFLPIIFSNTLYNKSHIYMMFAERFIFVFAIAIPFDIRDMTADSNAYIKTIPLLFGEKTAITISNILLLLFLLLAVIHYQSMNVAFLLPAYIISALSTLLIINYRRLQKATWYHTGLLDGTMLFQGLIICFFYYLHLISVH